MSLFARCATFIQTRKIIYASAVGLWLAVGVFIPVVQAQQAAEEIIAQKPFVSTSLEGLGVTRDKAGAPVAIAMVRGVNAPLQIINIKTQKRLALSEQRTDGVESVGVAYVTLPNRHVLVGTNTGYVYDVDPDKLAATELAPPRTGSLEFTAATIGENGKSYWLARAAGSGMVFGYTSSNGSWRDYGTVSTGVGGISYANSKLYIGSDGTNPSIFTLSVESGAQATLPLADMSAGSGALKVEAISGNELYITRSSTPAVTLVYSFVKNAVIDQKDTFDMIAVKPAPEPESVAVTTAPVQQAPTSSAVNTNTDSAASQTKPAETTAQTATLPSSATTTVTNSQSTNDRSQQASEANNKPTTTTQTKPDQTATRPTQTVATTEVTQSQVAAATTSVAQTPAPQPRQNPVYFGGLNQYDVESKQVTGAVNTQGLQPANKDCWIDDNRCLVFSRNGRLGIANIANRSFKLLTPSPLTGGYHPGDFLAVNSSDTVYAASSSLNTAVLQVDRDKTAQRKLISSGGGVITSMVTVGNTVIAGTNSGSIVQYDDSAQSSVPVFDSGLSIGSGSVTALSSAGNSQLLFGISQTGANTSGAIGTYGVRNRNVSMSPKVVLKNQAIGSLAYLNGVAFVGGKSATGTAELVRYDIAKQSVAATVTPAAAAHSIDSLAVGPNGHIYGMAGATLFEADPVTLSVLRRNVFSVAADPQPGKVLFWHGQLIVSAGGKIYQVKTDDLSATYVANGTSVIVNSQGDLYYYRGGAFLRMLAPEQKVAAVTKVEKSVMPHFNFSVVDIRLRIGVASLFGMLLLSGLGLRLHKRRVAHATYRIHR